MQAIDDKFILEGGVSYWNVDREGHLSLRSLFEFLQEAAIRHADQCGAGSHAKETRGASWVLHRMAVSVARYPRYEEPLRVVTWSSGIRGFKGFREFHAFCGGERVATASSVWLYFNLATKALCRVPREIAAGFPTHEEDVCRADLEKLRLDPPREDSPELEVSVRYSDIDGNGHVNNTAYIDYLQTTLAARGMSPRPAGVVIQYLREILPDVEGVRVCLERRGGETAFSLGPPGGLFAQGLCS